MEKQNAINYWQLLLAEYSSFITKKSFCADSTNHFKRAIKRLSHYALANNVQQYTPEIGKNFLQTEENLGYKGKTTIESRFSAIRHLEIFLFGTPTNKRLSQSNPQQRLTKITKPFPSQFAKVMDKYFEHLEHLNYCTSSIIQYRYAYLTILWDFDAQNVKGWGEIKANNLTDAFKRSTNKIKFYYRAKHLFKYLVAEEIIPFNYSGILPRMTTKQGIPSVYTRDEIDVLLKSIDRQTPNGKRNYAIILLAVRLGIRARDISLLRFDNVDFANSIITFVQQKTSVHQKLNFSVEVKNALYSYINNGRGKSNEPYIFLDSFSRPLTATAVPQIVGSCFKKSEIAFGMRKHGAHALRMTFASELIEENIPYDVVRVLLGHERLKSTKAYIQLSIEKLRLCALEVPAPNGLFAKYLKGESK